MTDLRHDCSRYVPLLARVSTRGVEVKCRDCRSVVTFPTSELVPVLLGLSTAAPNPSRQTV